MKITTIEPVLLSHVYPDDVTLEWSAGTIESWNASLVRVETDTGLVGWGEAGHALTGNEAIRGIVEAFAPYVEGRDPEHVRAIREDLYGRNLFWARGALPLGVIGAIEIAIYDVLGQARGVPLYELLGGLARESVPVYGSGGIAATPERRVEQAREYADSGFDVVKVRALADPMANVEYVADVLAALDGDAQLAFDAVQGSAGSPWAVKDAVRLGRELERFADRLYWYEEPCRAENLSGYARVRDAVDLRIAGIESRTGRHEFRDVVDAGGVDILHADVTISGGFGETRTISGYARSHDIPVGMHVWGTGVSLLANVHYAATDPNCEIVEYCQLPNPLREEMLPESFTHDDGTVIPPDEPGLGLDMPEDLTERFAFVPGKGMVFD
jgi:L-alanine-DL-glutamate epimerase-like enolase superfamily enzyme